MKLNIDNIILTFCIETHKQTNEKCVRVEFENNSYYIIRNQTIEEASDIVERNYKIVKNYYIKRTATKIDAHDLTCVCLQIVFKYFIMYNNWRTMYKKEQNRDLTFLIKDFDNPDTKRCIINYFEMKYPKDYPVKCKIMLALSNKEFEELDSHRKQFENMW